MPFSGGVSGLRIEAGRLEEGSVCVGRRVAGRGLCCSVLRRSVCRLEGTGMEEDVMRRVFGGQVCLVARMMPDERRIALEEAVALWRRSVKATHAFLTEEDIDSLVPSVMAGWLGVPELWSVRDAAGTMQAFMGIGGEMLEMLFVDPGWRGRGIGRALVELATGCRGVVRVDVNEQNPQAAGFYERMGFCVTGRSETDGEGRPFPLLHMVWCPGRFGAG